MSILIKKMNLFDIPIRYGVPIKLINISTGRALHSHSFNLETGSHSQEVTCFDGRDDND